MSCWNCVSGNLHLCKWTRKSRLLRGTESISVSHQAADLLCRTPDCTRKIEEPQRLLRSHQHLPICHKGRLNRFKINSTSPSETAAGATSTPSRSQSWQVDRNKKGIQNRSKQHKELQSKTAQQNLQNGPKLA